LVASNCCAETTIVAEEHFSGDHLVPNAAQRYRNDSEVATVIKGNLATGSWAVGAAVRGDPAGVTTDWGVDREPGLAHHWHCARGVRCARVFWADGLNVRAVGGRTFGDDRDAVNVFDGWALHA
jgi:hypothetical protein